MTELIKITTNDEGKQLVSARELHEGLEVGKKFTDWIKNRINKYGFEENEDYTIINEVSQNREGSRLVNREQTDYIITTDMAKELCMVENNEQGRKYRKYFIECEKKLKQLQTPSYMIDDPIERAMAWIEEQKQKKLLQQQNQEQQLLLEEQQPKVEFYDDVAGSKDAVAMKEVAKVLGIKGMGRNKLFKFLRDKKILDRNNMPYQEYVDRGYFRVIEQRYNTNNGDIKITFTTLVYNKGIEYIRKLLK